MASDCLWLAPLRDISLPNDTVHVWRVALEQPDWRVQQLAHTLAPDERVRSERFYFERDRRRFIVGRGALRAILASYLRRAPEQLRFRYGPHGKPALAESCDGSTLYFNLSHAHELALYAFTRSCEIGVDIEHLRPLPDAQQIARRFFSPDEYAIFCALPTEQQIEGFFNCWTRKEAYLKACGDGLARPLDQFDVSLAPGAPAMLLNVAGDRQETARWRIQALQPYPGYVAALCLEAHSWHLSCWRWPE